MSDQTEHQDATSDEVTEATLSVSTDEPAGEGDQPRRPTSLRDSSAPFAEVPRRRLSAAGFPGSPHSPVSDEGQAGNSGQMSDSGSPLRDRLPKVNVQVDPAAIEKLKTVVRERPEIGLGLAFAGGLVIATILKRLGRR